MIVCVAGNPAIDKLFEVETIRPGEIHRPEGFVPLPGGKGIHVAQVATVLGVEAIATGLLGGHHGRWLAETLAAEGVPGVFAWAAEGETRSCLTVADRSTESLTEFYEDGIRATPQDWAALTAVVGELLGQGPSWLAMAGSVPSAPAATDAPAAAGYAPLVTAARAAGVRSAVDSRGPDLARALEAGPDLVKINAAEACELLGLSALADVGQAHDAARAVRARAAGDGCAVVITLGEEGMVLIDPTGGAWHGVVAGHGAYPVGSGDAFLAGLLTALSADPPQPWPEAARLGLGAATANAQIPGAARLDPQRARALAAAAEIRRL